MRWIAAQFHVKAIIHLKHLSSPLPHQGVIPRGPSRNFTTGVDGVEELSRAVGAVGDADLGAPSLRDAFKDGAVAAEDWFNNAVCNSS